MNRLISSLSLKLTLPTIVVGVLFLLGVSLLSSHQAERSIERESLAIAHNVANTLIIASDRKADDTQLQRVLIELSKQNTISRLLIIKQENGSIFADNLADNIGKKVQDLFSKELLERYERYYSSNTKQEHVITDESFYHLEQIKLYDSNDKKLNAYDVYLELSDFPAI